MKKEKKITERQIHFRVLRRFAFRSIKVNKLRNFIMILTVSIMTLFTLLLLVMTSNITLSWQDNFKKQAGTSAHLIINDLTLQQVKSAKNVVKGTKIGISQSKASTIEVNEHSQQVNLIEMDQLYTKENFLTPDYGEAPVKRNEVVVSAETLREMGVPVRIGETIVYKFKTKDMFQEEKLTLVGYWTGSAQEKSGIWLASGSMKSDKASIYRAAVLFPDDKTSADASQKVISQLKLEERQYRVNWVYDPDTLHYLTKENRLYYVAIIIILFCGGLILLNVMQISIKHEIKLFGRMKTLGAGVYQIYSVVFFQALIIGLIGMLIGLIIGGGFGGSFVNRILNSYFSGGSTSIKWGDSLITVLLIFLVIVLSSIIPARTAGKVSTTELLNEDESYGFSHKSEKKWLGLPLLFQLSLLSLSRNKMRTIISIGFMVMGLVMLSCVYAIDKSFDMDKYQNEFAISDYSIADTSFVEDKRINDSHKMVLPESLVTEIEQLQGVTKKGRLMTQEVQERLPETLMKQLKNYYEGNAGAILSQMSSNENWTEGYQRMVETGKCMEIIYGIDGIVSENLVTKEGLLQGSWNEEKFNKGNYVIAQGVYDPANPKQPTYQVGEKVIIQGKEFEVMAIVEAPVTISEGRRSKQAEFSLSFFIPYHEFERLYPNKEIRKLYLNVNELGEKTIESYFNEHRNDEVTVTSVRTLASRYKRETSAMMLVQTLLSIVIFGIGMLNLVNTVITSATARRKEFGIMQSLGMTNKQMRTLFLIEGLCYSVVTLILSFFLSFLLISTVVKRYIEGQWSATYRLVIDPLLIISPILILVTLGVSLVSYFNIIRVSPIKRIEKYDI